MKSLVLVLSLLVIVSSAYTQTNTAKELVSRMSLEEKTKLIAGMGMNFSSTSPVVGQTMDKVPGAAGTTFAIARLKIPTTVVADGPAGLRISPIRNNDSSKTYYATAWPVATLLASTWDTKLVEQVGKAMGNEVKEYGVDVLLGPGLNIHRNPLGGRNFEYYSEDPLLSGKMAAAMVNGIESNGVGTSIKHFAANNQESNRNTINTIISERALREIYLKGFEITVKESQPWTVMSSYNKINGKFTSEDYDLLTTILRKEWGFKGLVMTDWFGGTDAVAQMKAGNDLLMPGTAAQSKAILEAIKSGSLDIKTVDQNAERIVDYILTTRSFKNSPYSNKPDLMAHAAIARTAATEGMVLLKNDNATLPISRSIKNIAAFGNTSYDFISGGTGSGDVNEAYTISLVEGLSKAGFRVDEQLKGQYTSFMDDYKAKHPKKGFFQEFMNPTPPPPEFAVDNNDVVRKATEADIALITIGRNAGEGRDRKVDNDFNLSDVEQGLIKMVAAAFHAKNKKVVVVLNIGGVIETDSWRKDVDAILLAWQPGLEAGNAVADILSGKANPSGKLATSFPMRYEDVPSAQSFPGKEFPEQATTGSFGMKLIPAEVIYEEGIYVGYRYYNSFGVKPAYEFGYGLSYTSFTYSNLRLSSSQFNGRITASIDITNSGRRPGKEAVQLYISAPGKEDKPSEELKGFGKTNVLQPGQKQTLTFTITAKDLASFYTNQSAWIADAGKYILKIGASSLDIRQAAPFSLRKDIIVEKTNKVLSPSAPINELKKKHS